MSLSEIRYRKALSSDIDYLLKLREETMNEHLLAASKEVGKENHLQRILYEFDQARIILLYGQAIGLLKVKEDLGEIEIIQIQIDSNHQGMGFGREILLSIIKRSKENRKLLWLSVLKKNRAKDLYESVGFEVVEEDDYSYKMEFRKTRT